MGCVSSLERMAWNDFLKPRMIKSGHAASAKLGVEEKFAPAYIIEDDHKYAKGDFHVELEGRDDPLGKMYDEMNSNTLLKFFAPVLERAANMCAYKIIADSGALVEGILNDLNVEKIEKLCKSKKETVMSVLDEECGEDMVELLKPICQKLLDETKMKKGLGPLAVEFSANEVWLKAKDHGKTAVPELETFDLVDFLARSAKKIFFEVMQEFINEEE